MIARPAALLLALLLSGAAAGADTTATPGTGGVFFAPADARAFALSIAPTLVDSRSGDTTHERAVTLGRTVTGEIRVTSMQVLADGDVPKLPAGTVAVVIGRHSGMCQPPHGRADVAILGLQAFAFVVDARGETIWELGVRNTLAVFRQVKDANDFGPEEALNSDPAKYTIYPCAKYE